MMASRILSRFLPNTEGELLDRHIPETEVGDDSSPHRTSSDHELDALLAEAAAEEHDLPPTTGTRPSTWDEAARVPPSDMEDDVPPSLLIEGGAVRQPTAHRPKTEQQTTAMRTEEQWRRAQAKQPLHTDNYSRATGPPRTERASDQHAIDAREQALWLWTNVQNLDAFLLELYQYYAEHGIYSIVLSRGIDLAYVDFHILYLLLGN